MLRALPEGGVRGAYAVRVLGAERQGVGPLGTTGKTFGQERQYALLLDTVY